MLGYLSVVVINQGLVKFFLTKQHNVKWEKFQGKLEELCRPRGSRLVAATQYEVLTQGNMELLEYIEKC